MSRRAHISGTLVLLALGAGPTPAEEPPPAPAEFADRWLACTRKADRSAVKRIFTRDAKLSFEAIGRSREVNPEQYSRLLADTLPRLGSFHRERGAVDVYSGEESEGGTQLVFLVTDRMRTQGFEIEAVQKETFTLAPGDPSRAVRYHSRTISCEALKKPESWMNYGGPIGLNGHLIETHFHSAPAGMGLVFAGLVVALALLLKVIHSLGIKRRL